MKVPRFLKNWRMTRVKLKTPILDIIEIEWEPQQNNGIPVYIVSKQSGRCLDIAHASEENGARIIQYSIHGGENQKWLLQPAGNGYYHIVSSHSGKCIDIAHGREEDGMHIIQS